MRQIGFEEFQVNTVTCEIDGEECDEGAICSHCPKAIEYCREEPDREYEEMIQGLIPSSERKTKSGKGLIDPMNTIAKFDSLEDLKHDKLLFELEEMSRVEQGHALRIPIHYPRFYLLRGVLQLGIPDYYLFKDFDWPVIAVYPNSVYAIAPEFVPEHMSEISE